MLNDKFKPEVLIDALFSFEAGVNGGVAPLLLEKNQLSTALNTTVRGTFVRPRPPYRKMTIDPNSQSLLQSALAQGKFQGGGYYKPDNGAESIMAAIAGRLMQITPGATSATVTERTILGDPNPASQPQAWMWQSEKWLIWNDGLRNPVFFDGTTSVRSNYVPQTAFATTTTLAFFVPAVGLTVTIDLTNGANFTVGRVFTVQDIGQFRVLEIPGVNQIIALNISAGPVGYKVPIGRQVSGITPPIQLPPGRMGAYGMGRNWMSLVDGKQFVASDLVGGSSGTAGNNYRDAVLNITENLYLLGGGNFTVPGNVGDIRAMRFAATLDRSLGQGPLQVFTTTTVFSCNAPVDRLTWQDLTNPILTESLISNGGLSQNATINAQSDILFRSVDGLRSLILARRDFDTWGNVPISREVEPNLAKDSVDLLGYSSAIVFDNRFLLTTKGVNSDQGVYWRNIIPLNFDPLSSLRGKAPSVYDSSIWTGLNTFQLFTGLFSNEERAFALTFNKTTGKIELYEILKSSTSITKDNGTDRIVWGFESPVLFNYPKQRDILKKLLDGEIYVDQIKPNSRVEIQAFYKPDQYPCWEPWRAWGVCAGPGKDQYRSRLGLGEPSGLVCDESNNRPMRESYTFQVKFIITGQCRFLGGKFKAVTMPDPEFAPIVCCPLLNLPGDGTVSVNAIRVILDESGKAILSEGGGLGIPEE